MMGLVLPSILPRRYTHIIGGILFLYFGIKLVLDSRTMEDKVSDELEEVEEELLHTKNKKDEEGGDSESDMENGVSASGSESGSARRKPAKRSASGLAGATAYKSTSFQATFVQSLTLTFLAEWGDRSPHSARNVSVNDCTNVAWNDVDLYAVAPARPLADRFAGFRLALPDSEPLAETPFSISLSLSPPSSSFLFLVWSNSSSTSSSSSDTLSSMVRLSKTSLMPKYRKRMPPIMCV